MAYEVTNASLDRSMGGELYDIYAVHDDENNRTYEAWFRESINTYWIRNRQTDVVLKQGGDIHNSIVEAIETYNAEPEVPEEPEGGNE